MNILLLGASGFVGRNVSEELRVRNIPFQPSSRTNGTDLRDLEAARSHFKGFNPDVVINCAAHVGSLNYVTEQAARVMLDNSRMILNMYQALAELNKPVTIINPVANCAYPAKADVFREEVWWDGHLHRSVLAYGSTRRLLWSVGESFAMQFGLRSIYLLTPNMYGPFDSTDPNKAHALNALISKFVKAERRSEHEIEIWGSGIAIREWLFARDFGRVIASIVDDINRVGLSEPVNIAQNFGLTVRELVTLINGYFGNTFSIRWNTQMPDGAPKKVMDDTRFRKVFNDFKFTAMHEGIPETIHFYQSIYPY
ncbi:MAG: NAD-dependent epimerase/dehydratase family protein [Cyclobacteriaceae bacterium]|nr:NAD-dependent epimerase/dehydratase family protein [Cyclobacteriaceae bacterium]